MKLSIRDKYAWIVSLYSLGVHDVRWRGWSEIIRYFDDNDDDDDDDCVSFSATMSRHTAGYIQDMRFLGREVWPRVKNVSYCHDSFSCRKYPASHPFPVPRQGTEHLGQVFDQFSVGRSNDVDRIRKTPVNLDCVRPVASSKSGGGRQSLPFPFPPFPSLPFLRSRTS